MKQISLEDLQGGAVNEMFEDQLQKVLENIADINTKPDVVRKIKIEFEIKPDKTRKVAETKLTVKSTLAGIKPCESFLFFEKHNGSLIAYEDMPGPELPGIEEIAINAGKENIFREKSN